MSQKRTEKHLRRLFWLVTAFAVVATTFIYMIQTRPSASEIAATTTTGCQANIVMVLDHQVIGEDRQDALKTKFVNYFNQLNQTYPNASDKARLGGVTFPKDEGSAPLSTDVQPLRKLIETLDLDIRAPYLVEPGISRAHQKLSSNINQRQRIMFIVGAIQNNTAGDSDKRDAIDAATSAKRAGIRIMGVQFGSSGYIAQLASSPSDYIKTSSSDTLDSALTTLAHRICSASAATPTPTATPISTPTPTQTPTPRGSATPTPTPTPTIAPGNAQLELTYAVSKTHLRSGDTFTVTYTYRNLSDIAVVSTLIVPNLNEPQFTILEGDDSLKLDGIKAREEGTRTIKVRYN